MGHLPLHVTDINQATPGYLLIPDRRQAIRQAVAIGNPGDVILLAGKGHENYQILGTRRLYFDDRQEARAALMAKAKADWRNNLKRKEA